MYFSNTDGVLRPLLHTKVISTSWMLQEAMIEQMPLKEHLLTQIRVLVIYTKTLAGQAQSVSRFLLPLILQHIY